jgi:hypothetical protein
VALLRRIGLDDQEVEVVPGQRSSSRAKSEGESLPRSEGLSRLVEQAREDPGFFHALVFEPEKALADLDYLDRREKGAIVSLRPEDVIAGLAGLIVGPGGAAAVCDYSCHDSCNSTCGEGSCFGTCMSTSCDHTCGARSCDITVEFTSRFFQGDPAPARRRGFFRPVARR